MRTTLPVSKSARSRDRSRKRRRGASILELIVGTVILGVFISSAGPMLRWVQVSRRTNDQHLAVLQELSNQMEALAALPVSELTAQRLENLTLSDSAQKQIPDASLSATLSEPADGLRKLTLSIAWQDEAGVDVQPKTLTAWFPIGANPEGASE